MWITLQYLEDSPDLLSITPQQAAEKLRTALQILPVSNVLIGWHVPQEILEVCQEETWRAGAKFYRWHPLLTGDGVFQPRPEMQVIGLSGKRIAGFHEMAEFTFVCPNHPEVVESIQSRVRDIANQQVFDGVFLDRVRWPSPASKPLEELGCFCEHCKQAAIEQGFDLERVQSKLVDLSKSSKGKAAFVSLLFGGRNLEIPEEYCQEVEKFFDFRTSSITNFVHRVAASVQNAGLEVGLDCFSPCLTRMVGQDLGALGFSADWIKIMTYAHTLGPAGLPYEFLGLLDFLTGSPVNMMEDEALQLLSHASGLSMPTSRRELQTNGFSSTSLEREIHRGVLSASIPVLAGIELVQIDGVANLNREQIERDGAAARAANPAGISISWDLLHIPLERLEIVHDIWVEQY